MSDCQHENFHTDAKIGRITDGDDGPVIKFVFEAEVTCADCGQTFGFIGTPAGVLNEQPTTSINGLTLIAPMVIGPVWRDRASYQLSESKRPDA